MDVPAYISTLSPSVRRALAPWADRVDPALLARCRVVRLKRSEELVCAHDRLEQVYVLCHGTVCSISRDLDGGTHIIDEFSAPAVFGEMEAIEGSGMYHSTLVAATAVEFIAISHDHYLSWLRTDAEALLSRSRWIISRLAYQSSRERSLLSWSGTERLAYVLLQQYREHAPVSGKLLVSLTRTQLAQRAGVSVKTVTRSLAQLVSAGAACLEGRKIALDNSMCELLEKTLHGDSGPSLADR